MEKFSEDLKQKLIVYLREKYKIDINNEKVEEYLNSIADFYLSLVDE